MTEQYTLYQYDSCPFCFMVRRFLASKGIEIPMRDTLRDRDAHRELVEGGGRATVPCLKIEDEHGAVRWMYESVDIMGYLNEKLGGATPN